MLKHLFERRSGDNQTHYTLVNAEDLFSEFFFVHFFGKSISRYDFFLISQDFAKS